MKLKIEILTALMVLASASTFADSVYLTNGNKMDGEVLENGENGVVLQMTGGLCLTLAKGDVERVEITGDYVVNPTATPTVEVPTPTSTPTVATLEIIKKKETVEPTPIDRERIREAYRRKADPVKRSRPVMRRAPSEASPQVNTSYSWEGVDPALAMKNFRKYKDRQIVWSGRVRGISKVAGSALMAFEPDGGGGAVCTVKLEDTNTSGLAYGDQVTLKGHIAGEQYLGGDMKKVVFALGPILKSSN